MTKVQVVNAQSVDGVYRKRDEVIEVSAGRARDLKRDGKVRAVVEEPKPVQAASKPSDAKGGK